MKWATTTLLWLASCARSFELTERSDKMRPIFTETRGLKNHERPRRRIPQFRGANHTGSRVRKPCANPLKESGNRAASVGDFRAFRLFCHLVTAPDLEGCSKSIQNTLTSHSHAISNSGT
jgi:hypothetical protein